MGRKRTHLELSRAERAMLHRLLRTALDPRMRERAQWALWASTGEHTLEDLAAKIGRARATIQNWLDKYSAGGVGGLLERDTPPGSSSPVGSPAVQAELRAGWRTGRWSSAAAVAVWLQQAHGIKRARKSLYYWLGKIGRRGSGDAEGMKRPRLLPGFRVRASSTRP